MTKKTAIFKPNTKQSKINGLFSKKVCYACCYTPNDNLRTSYNAADDQYDWAVFPTRVFISTSIGLM